MGERAPLRMVRFFRFFLLCSLILALDIFSKALIHHFLPLSPYESHFPYGGIGVFKGFLGGIDFSLVHVMNKGGAWGIFSSMPKLLLILRIGAIAFLGIYILFFQKTTSKQIPLVCIFAGALGNVFDMFFYGHVIDMLHFTFWGHSFAVFNIADSFICIGIFLLFILSSFKKKTLAKI